MFIFGYIDPGTGSFIMQAIIAALVAVPFILKTQWKKIKGIFNRQGE